jgi:hypothetical protein
MKLMNLCRRPHGCCPELHKGSDGSISITDDYGGIVTLKKEEFEKLQQAKV